VTIEVLSPAETEEALKGSPARNEQLGELADALMPLIDTDGSVFAPGLTESTINMLRTKVGRAGARLTARKVRRGSTTGHVLQVRTVE
jgi:hypothetical protein